MRAPEHLEPVHEHREPVQAGYIPRKRSGTVAELLARLAGVRSKVGRKDRDVLSDAMEALKELTYRLADAERRAAAPPRTDVDPADTGGGEPGEAAALSVAPRPDITGAA